MKYMLLIYANPEAQPAYSPELQKKWTAVTDEMDAAGVRLGGGVLTPVSDATTVRQREGKLLVSDGPFAETHEHLAGYILVECKDLDEAIGWASKIPAARYGSIEVRPLHPSAQ